MTEKDEFKGVEKSVSFKEFYCEWYTLELNTLIFWKILRSEGYAYFLPKKKPKKIKTLEKIKALEEIKTKEELEEEYYKILKKTKSLVITKEKIEKAEELLFRAHRRKKSSEIGDLVRIGVKQIEEKNKKNIQGGTSIPLFYSSR